MGRDHSRLYARKVITPLPLIPMSNRKKFNQIYNKAQRESFKLVKDEVEKCLPVGWTLYLMVGWGLMLDDDQGNAVISSHTRAARLPKGVRNACLLAADYCDIYGYGNERIYGKKK